MLGERNDIGFSSTKMNICAAFLETSREFHVIRCGNVLMSSESLALKNMITMVTTVTAMHYFMIYY